MGQRPFLDQFQRDTYLASRTAGDLNALRRGGPERLIRRIARRRVTRWLLRGAR